MSNAITIGGYVAFSGYSCELNPDGSFAGIWMLVTTDVLTDDYKVLSAVMITPQMLTAAWLPRGDLSRCSKRPAKPCRLTSSRNHALISCHTER